MTDFPQPLQALLAPAFVLLGSAITWAEILAFGLAVWMVICNMRVHVLAWPLAVLSSLIYFMLFWSGKLYGEASLQLLFAALAIWGWWQWLRGRGDDGQALRVRRLTRQGWVFALLAILLAWPALGLFLQHQTDSQVPYWDAFPTVASLLGQWLLGRKSRRTGRSGCWSTSSAWRFLRTRVTGSPWCFTPSSFRCRWPVGGLGNSVCKAPPCRLKGMQRLNACSADCHRRF
ncbi:nicotinamide riboside transporter PnuC [Roseateles sp. GG27B]